MADRSTALVSAQDYVAVVRSYADRVHDLLRRTGCPPDAAAEITQISAVELAGALANDPSRVSDLVGWWVDRALRLARRVAEQAPTTPGRARSQPTGVLAGTTDETELSATLDRLPTRERIAVLLRDAYDLPSTSVGVALSATEDVASATVTRGRLALAGAGAPVPDLGDHAARPAVTLGALGRLADGSLPSVQANSLRRHVATCAACSAIVAAATTGRRLAAGLPVLALSDEDRDELLAEVGKRAAGQLPSAEEIALAREEAARPRTMSAGMIAGSIALALALGVIVAYATRPSATPPAAGFGSSPGAAATSSPTPSGTPSHRPSASADRSPGPAPSTPPAGQGPATSGPPRPPTSSPRPNGPAAITISPTSGPNGTVVSVTGDGWSPNSPVTVSFIDHTGVTRSVSTVSADSNGAFTATVTATGDPGLLPSTCTVRATGSGRTASQRFNRTL
ncbi:MAG TPA: hypothetical protein VNG13_05565 [Mycobacteriales bacterium]|nr:hypothetical protein [Mycobacteriales bacterium]